MNLQPIAAAFALLAASACASAPPERPPYGPVVIPFEQGSQGHIVIPVTVEGVAGHAVLDNGASTSVIDRDFAREKNLDHGVIAKTVIKTLTAGYELGQTTVIGIGGIDEKVTPLLLPMSLLSGAAGKPVMAIVGEEFFERHVVEVSFSTGRLLLHDRRTFVPPSDLPVIPLKSKRTAKTQIPATVEDQGGYDVTFDLGSSAFALVDEGKLADRLTADGRPWTPTASGIVKGGDFTRAEGRMFSAREIEFAGFSLADIPTSVMPENFVAPSDVSLGVGALSQFDVIFDVGGKRMWMRPNASYGQPFPHPVVGVTFAAASQAGALQLVAVAANSPADRAGLKKGDVVARLRGEDATIAAFGKIRPGDTVELELKDGSKRQLTAGRYF